MLSDRIFLFRVGYRWVTRFLALGCYSFLLMPGFIQGLLHLHDSISIIHAYMLDLLYTFYPLVVLSTSDQTL